MRWSRMSSLTLLLLAAAAAAPGPCGPSGNTAPFGRAEGVGAPPDTDLPTLSATDEPCDSSATEPAAMPTTKPADVSDDVLHSLGPSDALRRIDRPRAAPVYR